MRPIRDPEGAELSHLLAACDLTGKKILEIGCGDGKFIRQYAGKSSRVVGIDSELSDLHTAKDDKEIMIHHVDIALATAEKLPFPSHAFEIAIFACSL